MYVSHFMKSAKMNVYYDAYKDLFADENDDDDDDGDGTNYVYSWQFRPESSEIASICAFFYII